MDFADGMSRDKLPHLLFSISNALMFHLNDRPLLAPPCADPRDVKYSQLSTSVVRTH